MKNKIRIVSLVVLVIQLSITSLFSQSKIDKAYRAYRNCSYIDANKKYLEVWNDVNSSKEDKVIAGKKLAYLSWHINQDIDDAREFINLTLKYKINEIDLLLELSKYELEAQNFEQALDLCNQATKLSKNHSHESKISIQEAGIVLDEAIFLIKTEESLNSNKLKDVLKKIAEINKKESGQLDVNEIQLGLALILKDGKFAYEAWEGYFRIPSNEKAKGILSNADKDLEDVLTNWKDSQLSYDQRNKLVLGLANSRFYHYADLVNRIFPATETKNPNEINDILSYYSFCESVNSISEDYHRNIAINNGVSKENREKFYQDVSDAELILWNKLTWNGKSNKFSDSNFKDELYIRFGTIFKDVKPYYTSMGKTGLFLFAHTISDQKIVIKQYGYEPTIHFVNLDFTYANSYDGWFLGSKTGRLGGWCDKDLIVQMRRAYSDNPVLMWNKITNEQARKEWEESIVKLSIEDDKIAKDNPIVYLPGLVNRLRYDACIKIKDSLKNQGLTGDELRMAFISKFEQMRIQATIMGHEGRHAIDSKYRFIFEPTCKDFEYRAKLSEILFSEDPFFTFAFSPVYMRNMTSKSKHSQGSRKVIINLVNWMDENQNTIKGFDTKKPTLVQLDLLTEVQLKNAFKEMDPLYKKRGSK
ncbi:MAG: hypothetical protein K8R74_05665 [Bacteroidales bacterium]|nr:hypothetical protein [Bacteroidales bacterium]